MLKESIDVYVPLVDDAKELITFVKELHMDVVEWLRKKHPQLI